MNAHLPTVAVFTLGGTIASVPDAAGHDAVPRLTAEQIVDSVPRVREVAHLELKTFRQYPSGDLAFLDVVELARAIDESSADGVVVTQGTDTLEETSFLLSMMVTTNLPVVLTGAMRNAGLPGADGPANLLSAVQVAASSEARGLGPVVCFADEIHAPRFVRKSHTSSVATFQSAGAGPLGWVTEGRVRIPLKPRSRQILVPASAVGAKEPNIPILSLALGSGPLPVEMLASHDAVVLGVFGGGHVPSRCMESVRELASRVPVVMASRTGAGELYQQTYAFPGSESDLLASGVISAGALDVYKARGVLSILLADGADASRIAKELERMT